MSRFYKPSQTPLIDYSYNVPIEYINAGLQGRQMQYDKADAELAQLEALKASIQTLPDEVGGQYIGDKTAGKALAAKYDSLVSDAVSKYDGDLSKISGELRKIKAEAAKDFGPNGVATALAGRVSEYSKTQAENKKRYEENKLNDADLYLSTQGLNPFDDGQGGFNSSLGMRGFGDREDYNVKALEFIKNVAEQQGTDFIRYDPKNPESMYGYVVEKTQKGKQFMDELQQYMQNIPGFSSSMQRDLEYANLNPDVKARYDEAVTKYRMEGVLQVDTEIAKYKEMLKNPKAFGATTQQINDAISQLEQKKDIIGNPSNPNYFSDDDLKQNLYIQEKTRPFEKMEYLNPTYDLEQDWVTKANYEHSLALDRMKKQQEITEAANRTTFIGNGVIQPNQIAQELSDLPDNIKKTEEQISTNRKTLEEINNKMLAVVNPRDAILNPSKYQVDVANRQQQELKIQEVMTGVFNATQKGERDKFMSTLPAQERAWVENYYNDYIATSMQLADNVVQKQQFEALKEAYFPEAVKKTQAFNDAYAQYSAKYSAKNPYNDRYANPKSRLQYEEDKLSQSEFYAMLLSQDNIPGIKDNESTRKSILKEAGIEDEGIITKIAWNANLDKQIIKPATQIINASGLGSFQTTDGSNAGEIANKHFGNEAYTVSVVPGISPSGSLDNVLQVTLTPVDKNSKTKPLPLAINPGDENAPVFIDMFKDIYQDGIAKGDQTLIDLGALGTFANTFKGQTTMPLSTSTSAKGLPIKMSVGINNVVMQPTENRVNGVQKYKVYFVDENGMPIKDNKGNVSYLTDVNGVVQKDIMGMFTELGKELLK